MAKRKLFEDIKFKPARFYRLPADVMRDRRFGDAERMEILQAWLQDAGPSAPQVESVIAELQNRLSAKSHAAE
jgi:hypothetical protein